MTTALGGRSIRVGDATVVLIVAVAVAALVARFLGLGISPPGFYEDEAIASAQLVCLKYTGADAGGQAWPLISSIGIGPANAFWTPLWIYPGLGWITVFGDSPAALRSFEALLSVIGVVATAGVARNFLGNRVAAWTLLIGAVSPWSWTLGRLAFGNSAITGVALLMTGLWLFTRGGLRRPPRWFEAFGGSLLVASAAVVNHTRLVAVVMLVLIGAVLIRRHLVDRVVLVSAGLGFFLAAIPVLVDGGRARLWSRAAETSVFSDPSLPASGVARITAAIGLVIGNVFKHLSPDFLLFSGDPNQRHSTQIVGQLGWLEVLLVVVTPVAIALVLRRSVGVGVPRVYLVMVAAGVLTVLLSASATNEALPHALRMFPAQAFLALGLGLVGAVITERWRLFPIVGVAVSLLFAAFFIPRYFGEYPKSAARVFDVEIVAAAERARESGDAEGFFRSMQVGYVRTAAVYFMAADTGWQCPGELR